MGRMSAYTLVALPFLMAAAIFAINPRYLAPLVDHPAPASSCWSSPLFSISVGALILKKIVSFKV